MISVAVHVATAKNKKRSRPLFKNVKTALAFKFVGLLDKQKALTKVLQTSGYTR